VFYEIIVISPQQLISGIKEYSQDVDESLIKNAYIFALEHHGTQIRDSGDPFFSHPLEVAEILISLKMDQQTVIAGILHDTVEDTPATIKTIEKQFGKEIADIVDGVTKLSKFEGATLAQKQAENFKKLLLSAAADIRILIIKLADRLHNMRTLKYKRKKSKRYHIAKETIEIYAPLAERVGMSSIKDELQDISFQELYPDIYSSIKGRLNQLYESSVEIISHITSELESIVKGLGIDCSITGRLKTPYSIWQKLNIRNISFEQLSDIMAFRLIVDSVPQCYQLLGGIHRKYMVVPGRFRDYISTPKNNSYQSLHTSIIGPLNKRIEIQIRTKEMHKVAEYGIAAHWNYKDGGISDENNKNSKWLKNLVQILENTSDMGEFLEDSKVEMYTDSVFAITPKGLIISLPKGASALDFAYAIHSDVGNHAVSAKINGKPMPLKTVIQNGDQIEIFTDPSHVPSSYLENYVVTIKAKSSIRRAIQGIEKEKIEIIGKTNFYEFFENRNLEISKNDIKFILNTLGFERESIFFYSLGNGALTLGEVVSVYNKLKNKTDEVFAEDLKNPASKQTLDIVGIPETPILPVNCCSPVPGDKISGLYFPGKGVEIHIVGCKNLLEKEASSKCKVIDLSWTTSAFGGSKKYTTKLLITMISQPGNLSKIAEVIEKKNATIVNLKLGEKIENFAQLQIEIEVADSYQVTMIIAAIRDLDCISQITRA
jgi:GTP pyrophosphokinase